MFAVHCEFHNLLAYPCLFANVWSLVMLANIIISFELMDHIIFEAEILLRFIVLQRNVET